MLLVPCLLALWLGGCAAKAHVDQFTATPAVACPGDEVTLLWRTNGRVRLSADPVVEGLGAKASSGAETITVQGPTRFRIDVSRFLGLKKSFAEREVPLAPRELEYGVVEAEGQDVFTCPGEHRALESTLVLDESRMSPRSRVVQVTNMNARRLVLVQDSVSKAIDEGATSSGFAGRPAVGRWIFRVPLEAGESCEDALDSVDGRLIVKFQFSCQE